MSCDVMLCYLQEHFRIAIMYASQCGANTSLDMDGINIGKKLVNNEVMRKYYSLR